MTDTELKTRPARVALLCVTPEVFMCLGCGIFEVIANPLPEDAAFVEAFYDELRHLFTVIVTSESFAPVAKGEKIPDLPAPVIRRLQEAEA